MLVPAIKGTVGVLESVTKKAPRVERVVITSSFAAMVDFTKGNWPGHVYTEADWNHTTFEYAKTADAMVAYTASKALAEKAAWQFVEERKPHFKLTVLNPPMVFGPAAHNVSLAAPNLSAWDINRFLSGELDDVPETGFWSFVDVRDLAQAHVRALEVPEAGNERFFVVSGRYSYQQTADVLRRSDKLPAADKAKVPVGKPGQNYPGPDVYEVDNAKSKRILGISYRSFEESIVDAALNIVEVRQKAGSQ
jgi:nucleoside-diphosphate-sugar epimerase